MHTLYSSTIYTIFVCQGSQEAKVELGDEEEAVEVAAGGETAEEKV